MKRRLSKQEIFEQVPVMTALLHLTIPTVLGQIILVIYNMADTFFIGLRGNDAMISAAAICMPAFMFLSAISNLFGVGGASVISRCLGAGKKAKASYASSFAFWGCVITTVLYSLFCLLAADFFIDILGGTHPEVHVLAVSYLRIAVIYGGFGSSMSLLLSHLIRAEGHSLLAGSGIVLGGVLNIILDPVMMFRVLPPGHEVTGAAIATALANLTAFLWLLAGMYYRHRKGSVLSLRPVRAVFGQNIPKDILSTGLPACMMTLLENISYAILDKLMSGHGTLYQAGLGVSKKINMLAHCIVRGIAQGSLPLIGYNYAAKNYPRMKKTVSLACALAVGTAVVCMVVFLCFSHPLTEIFLRHDSGSSDLGALFLRIFCVGAPFSALAYIFISFFQATGHGLLSFVLAILRKGIVDIPLMFLLSLALPVTGLVLATPLADVICCAFSLVIFSRFIRRLKAEEEVPNTANP